MNKLNVPFLFRTLFIYLDMFSLKIINYLVIIVANLCKKTKNNHSNFFNFYILNGLQKLYVCVCVCVCVREREREREREF